ncbi:hypothetical protein Tco_0158931 [Tanacetum coccineum]
MKKPVQKRQRVKRDHARITTLLHQVSSSERTSWETKSKKKEKGFPNVTEMTLTKSESGSSWGIDEDDNNMNKNQVMKSCVLGE